MARPDTKPKPARIARVLVERHGRTYAEEAGIELADAPAPLFQLLVAATLLSARISAQNATRAARAFVEAGFKKPEDMTSASWQDRVDVLTANGYKRYDESTATMLGESAHTLLEAHGGDLRNLRNNADGDPRALHSALQDFKGIGKVGADIFLREAQAVWPELHPYADDKVLAAAERLGLPRDPTALAELVDRDDFVRLASALIRVDLEDAYDEVLAAAS